MIVRGASVAFTALLWDSHIYATTADVPKAFIESALAPIPA